MHRVMSYPADYNSCRKAVDSAFDLFPIDFKGKRVLVKPNVLRSAKPEQGITTHPAVLRAVVDKLKELDPMEIIVGDNPGIFSYGENEKAFKECGIMEASSGYYKNIGLDSVEVDFNPDFMDRVRVSRDVLEADLIISVPKFKTHGLTVLTGAIKNSYGIIPGALKSRLHSKAWNTFQFNRLMVDVFALRVPDLFIVDAVVGMEGNGPASPDLRDIGKIIAGDNAVAVDAVLTRMMGLKPEMLPFFDMAREKGLGSYGEKEIEITGKMDVIPGFKAPPIITETTEISSQFKDFLMSRLSVRPRADREKCTSCGSCIEHCPENALSMIDDLPVVDTDKCITCFCCQEICPEMAITLS